MKNRRIPGINFFIQLVLMEDMPGKKICSYYGYPIKIQLSPV